MPQITDMSPETRAALNAIIDAMTALAAQLDADAGVTDTDYEATVAAILPSTFTD